MPCQFNPQINEVECLDKKEIFDSVDNMESQIGQLYIQLGELKQHLAEVLEENNALKLENEHLRRRLKITSDREKKNEQQKEETEKEKLFDIGKAMTTLLDYIKKVSIFVIFILVVLEKMGIACSVYHF